MYSIVAFPYGNVNILANNNYVGSAESLHELQNWFFINCNKFEFDFKKLLQKLND